MRAAFKWVRDNGLSLVFIGLFFIAVAAQAWSGFHAYSELLRAHGRPPIHFWPYLGTGDFLDGIFSNW